MVNYNIERSGKYIVFNLSGRIDIVGAEKLEVEFKRVVDEENRYFIIINRNYIFCKAKGYNTLNSIKSLTFFNLNLVFNSSKIPASFKFLRFCFQ
jgi:hypothetical protein